MTDAEKIISIYRIMSFSYPGVVSLIKFTSSPSVSLRVAKLGRLVIQARDNMEYLHTDFLNLSLICAPEMLFNIGSQPPPSDYYDMMTGAHVTEVRLTSSLSSLEAEQRMLNNFIARCRGWVRSRQHCDPRLRIFKDYEIVVWRTKNISTDENLSTLYHEEWVFNFCAGEKLCVLSFGIKSLNLSFSNCIHSLSPAQQQMKINNYDSVFFLRAWFWRDLICILNPTRENCVEMIMRDL